MRVIFSTRPYTHKNFMAEIASMYNYLLINTKKSLWLYGRVQKKSHENAKILKVYPTSGPVPGPAPIAGKFVFVKIASKVVSFRILKEIFVVLTFWPKINLSKSEKLANLDPILDPVQFLIKLGVGYTGLNSRI